MRSKGELIDYACENRHKSSFHEPESSWFCHRFRGRVGSAIGADAEAVEVASGLIREIGYEPVLIGGLEMGKYLMPGTPLAGEHSAEEIRQIAAGLE